MTVAEIMDDLQAHGDANIKKLLLKHGIREPFFGVKVEHLKTIVKKVKKDYQLAKDLYAAGNADAMYLAGLIADDDKMTEADLQTWVRQAVSQNISEYTVPWVAAGSKHGYELAMEWINAQEDIRVNLRLICEDCVNFLFKVAPFPFFIATIPGQGLCVVA